MAYTINSSASPTPDPAYSGIFIPTLWSGKMVEKFYDASVLPAISNSDYEGEITNYGDKVTIRTKPTIAINDYEAYQSLTSEAPSSQATDLLIDQGKYWSTILDDVMEIQSDIDQLSAWADDASEQMKIEIDTDVLADIAATIETNVAGTDGAHVAGTVPNAGATAGRKSGSVNLGGSDNLDTPGQPLTIDKTNVIDLIVSAAQALDEYNIPESGRWMVIPAWVAALIKRSELRDASLTGDGTSILRNGRLGMVDRMTLYVSNLLPDSNTAAHGYDYTHATPNTAYQLADGEFRMYFGHSHGFTFASQLTKVETLRAESQFGTIMRGLQVYGRKVIDNSALGTIVAQQ
jgi:hypothetical protein